MRSCRHRTDEWVMSHIWMRHVTNMNESCHTYDGIMSHKRMSHVSHRNASRICMRSSRHCTYDWVMSRMWLSHVASVRESCHTYECVSYAYEWVMSRIEMRRGYAWGAVDIARMNVSCHTSAWVVSQIWVSHGTHMHAVCHTYEWVVSRI